MKRSVALYRTLAPHIKVEKYLREGGGSRNPRFRLELKTSTPGKKDVKWLGFI